VYVQNLQIGLIPENKKSVTACVKGILTYQFE
jgi:hypothetical protein